MISYFFLIFAVHYLFTGCNCVLPTGQQAEQTLITTLLNSYDKKIRPDDRVSVEIIASIQQIISIDDKQQIMTSSSFITQLWQDERLTWAPSNYSDIEVVMLPVKSLWIPDTFVLNSADANGFLPISDYNLASVSNDGDVAMILPAITIRTRCNLFAQKFPFDRQICSINLTSWAQGENRIAYTENDSLLVDTSGYSQHPLWELVKTDIIVYRAEDRAPFEFTYNNVISIQLYLRRKPSYFILNGIFACLVLNCVTLIAFVLPLAIQISLSMICLMTYSVYSLSFSSLFPQQSEYIMMITLFFLLSISWTLVSLIWFVAYNYFTTKGDIPKALNNFCERLQRMFSCRCSSVKINGNKVNNKNDIVENSQMKKDGDANVFILHSQNHQTMENVNNTQPISTQAISSVLGNSAEIKPMENPAYSSIDKTIEREKPKCNFCNRCETCQATFDKDKAKGKDKKEIEAKWKILNYLVLFCILLLMFISNMILWLIMAA